MRGSPVRASASTKSTLSSVVTSAPCDCNPSRGPTSVMNASAGSAIPAKGSVSGGECRVLPTIKQQRLAIDGSDVHRLPDVDGVRAEFEGSGHTTVEVRQRSLQNGR